MSDMEEGPAHVSGDEVVNLGDCRSEALNVQLLVQENRGDLRACQQVFEVGVGMHQGVVAGLDLFARGLELPVGRLECLVRGKQFFVRRLELLVGRLDVLDGSLEIVARGLQLVLELLDERVGLLVRSAHLGFLAIHERSEVLEYQEIETAPSPSWGMGWTVSRTRLTPFSVLMARLSSLTVRWLSIASLSAVRIPTRSPLRASLMTLF